MKRILQISMFILPFLAFGQINEREIEQKWKEINRLEVIGNYNEAIPIINELKKSAQGKKDDALEVKIVLAETMGLRKNETSVDLFEKIEQHFIRNLNGKNNVQRAVLYQAYALFLLNNVEDNPSSTNNEFLGSTKMRKFEIIDSLLKKSIADKESLLKQPMEKGQSLWEDSKQLSIHPTLYHFNLDTYLRFLLNDRKKNLDLYNKLLTDVLAYNKRKGLEDATAYILAKNLYIENRDTSSIIEGYEGIIQKTNSQFNAQIYTLLAAKLGSHNPKLQVRYLQKAKRLYPNSPWTTDLDSLINLFNGLKLNLKHSSSIPTNEYVPIVLSIRNIDKIYLKVFKFQNDLDYYSSPEVGLSDINNKAKEIYTEQVALKPFDDFEIHTTYYKINPLSAGKYRILISNNPEFENNDDNKLVTASKFEVTDYFFKTAIEKDPFGADIFSTYLVNRKNGESYKKKDLQILKLKDGKTSLKTASTNHAGEILLPIPADSVKFYSDDIGIFLPEENQHLVYHKTKNFSEEDSSPNELDFEAKTLLDRSIYRPGQKVLYKVISYQNDMYAGKILAGKRLTVLIKTSNEQIIDSLVQTTDSFGSINGEFVLPEKSPLGFYQIMIKEGNQSISSSSFRVEEYKRPTFKIYLNKIKDTYTSKDTAEFTGLVESFSGVVLGATTVSYTITVITHDPSTKYINLPAGTLQTENDGTFKIRVPLNDTLFANFKGYSILLNTYATSPTGESQKAYTHYIYSDILGTAEINLDEEKLFASKFDEIEIIGKNENQEKVNLSGEIQIYKKPDFTTIGNTYSNSLYSTKFLDEIEFHVFSPEEYIKYFPTRVTKKDFETQNDTLVATYPFDSSLSPTIKVDPTLFSSGRYYIKVVNVPDSALLGYRSFELADSKTRKKGNKNFLVYNFDKENYQINDQVKVDFYTDLKNAKEVLLVPFTNQHKLESIILSIENGHASYSFLLDSLKIKNYYQFQATLINENKIENLSIQIPLHKENNILKISANTFRNKILPGSKEKWSFNISLNDKAIPASVFACMYDFSLNEFFTKSYTNKWNLTSYPYRYEVRHNAFFTLINARDEEDYIHIYIPMNDLKFHQLNSFSLWNTLTLDQGDISLLENNNRVYEFEAIWTPAYLNKVDNIPRGEFAPKNVNPGMNELMPIYQGVDLSQVQARKNLQETTFFYPNLYTDKDGNISFEFDSPEALTKWKLLLFAHGKNLEVGSEQFYTQTQKQLMVRPNLPRYFRESDQIEIIAQVQNLSGKPQQGKAKIEIINPVDNADISEQFVLGDITTDFSVEKDNNQTVSWKLKVPEGYPSVQVKIVAASGEHSDGEIVELPVLSNKVLVSQTEKIALKAGQKQDFSIASAGKDNLQAKVQVHSNPILEIISALDYLKNYPYECTEQSSSKWFGLKMVQYIGKHYPAISDYFRTIKVKDTKNRLEENAQLNELKLQEMPWLRDIHHDSKRLEALAELFNSNIESELKGIEHKLLRGQLDNGSFPWFEGGKSDTHISMRILEVVGKVFYLDHSLVNPQMNGSMRRLATYLDQDSSITREKASANIALDYLYARHFWNSEVKVPEKNSKALRTKIAKAPIITAKGPAGYAAKAWIVNQLFGDSKESNEIRNRIQQEVILDPDRGMYWESNGKQYNDISLHSYMLEAYKLHDPSKLNPISQWIFFRKEANYWRNTWMTVDAIYSLLLANNPKDFNLDNAVNVLVDGQKAQMDSVVLGQVSKTFNKQDLDRNRSVQIENHNDRTVFGGVFHQYFLPVSEVKASTNDIKVSKQYMVERNGKWVESNEAKLGEKIKVSITVINDQDLEYVHLKDSRPAGVEPVFVPSGYSWRNNYYFTLKDASTNYFFNSLQKGKRTFEYEVKANNVGEFNSGITSIESMYDPTVNARSDNKVIRIVK